MTNIANKQFSLQNYQNLINQGLSPLLAKIYAARNINDSQQINYQNLQNLLRPETLLNANLAAEIIAKSLINNEKIVIVGDYDCDGATSTVVAIRALQMMGIANDKIAYIIPSRLKNGYGLTPKIVQEAYETLQPDLLITVDCGIVDFDGVNFANSLGMKVIVTDHHSADKNGKLPEALCVVNPNQPNCKFASKNIAGVGVIFYVMCALRQYLSNINYFAEHNLPTPNLGDLLAFVAIGTVADVVNLSDFNNRLLINIGLQKIKGKLNDCPLYLGIRKLCEVAKIQIQNLNVEQIGFQLAPRINAAGRLETMDFGIECLLATDENQAKEYANELNNLNQQRKAIGEEIQNQASEIAENIFQNKNKNKNKNINIKKTLCLYDSTWHEGVIGIAASKVKDEFFRPTFIFTDSQQSGVIKGSGRSIPNLHLRDVLANIAAKNEYKNLFLSFGGHAMAAGLSMKAENFDKFCTAFESEVNAQIDENLLTATIDVDGELSAEELNFANAKMLENQIFGNGFSEPKFVGNFIVCDVRILKQIHLKLLLKIGNSQNKNIEAVQFFAKNLDIRVGDEIKIVYTLGVNRFANTENLQLKIEYLEKIQVAEN